MNIWRIKPGVWIINCLQFLTSYEAHRILMKSLWPCRGWTDYTSDVPCTITVCGTW